MLSIAKQTFTDILREGRFRTAALLISLFFLLSVVGAYNYYASLKKQHTEASEKMRGQWESQKDKNPHSAPIMAPMFLSRYIHYLILTEALMLSQAIRFFWRGTVPI